MSAVRFTVTKTDDGAPIGESLTDGPSYGSTASQDNGGDVPQVRILDPDDRDDKSKSSPIYTISGQIPLDIGNTHYDPEENVQKDIQGENQKSTESDPLTQDDVTNMALYEEELQGRPMISRILSEMANYQGGIQPNIEQMPENEEGKGGKKKAPKAQRKLGTLLGVYFPCIQNIFGVILFIRLVWLVGLAGVIEGFFIVFMCCCTTMLTAISMSAIATNGVVSSGGSYFMISRALGPEFGGAVGILFYLGTSVAGAMYIIGAVEILLNYIAPQIVLFGSLSVASVAFNNYRVYGTILLIIMFIWVFLGVKFVSKFAPIALACVILSIICIYIGIFIASPNRGPEVCLVGERIMLQEAFTTDTGELFCSKNSSGPLYNRYCPEGRNDSSSEDTCEFFKNSDVRFERGIPGLASGVFMDNLFNRYYDKGDVIDTSAEPHELGDIRRGEVVADISTNFILLLAIFFPSCTGIMAGSNRSGDLLDPSRSIPMGTIAAILTTSFVYLSTVIFFGATIDGAFLRDKFGGSIGGGLIVAELAWPSPWVILIGSFLSTVGAGLQSLTGAPRLLQAIASDGVIPFLAPFAVTTKSGEPLRALLLTVSITLLGVLVASLDYIAPIITMFFLMCYGFVNLACAVQTLLRTPNWRPRFKYYHWVLSLFGVALCLVLMFISSWYYALVAIAIAAGIYKYIEYKGAEKEWGDGIRGLAMSAARFALMRLEDGPPHVKNWRPQLLIFLKLDEQLQPKYPKMLTFSSQLKAGKGLTLVNSILQGNIRERYADAQAARQTVHAAMKKERAKGFCDVVVASNISDGMNQQIQSAGVGGLRHNTVLLGWPYGWRHEESRNDWRIFIDALHNISASHHAVIIPKGINQFPDNSEKMSGTIDIWWIVHDGGLLMLLPFLLTQHKVWKNCKMRIFTVAQMEDNSIQMKQDLKTFLYHLRLSAEIEVVEMPDSDISAYTYERTLMMEQRTEIMKEMKNFKKKEIDPQMIIDNAHKIVPGTGSGSPEKIQSPVDIKITVDMIPEDDENADAVKKEDDIAERNLYTFTPGSKMGKPAADGVPGFKSNLLAIKPDDSNVRRMHTAVRLNEVIVEKSHGAALVIINLPGPPKSRQGEQNYMEYLEVLTEGLDRCLMVRGGGREVITIYS